MPFSGAVAVTAVASTSSFVQSNGYAALRSGHTLFFAVFLVAATSWAFTDFIAMTVDDSANVNCQVAITFASSFDQISRTALEQGLLGIINNGAKMSWRPLAIQVAILIRFVIGGVLVGVQRSQFYPVCVARTSILPLGIVLPIVDLLVTISLLWLAFDTGVLAQQTYPTHRKRFSASIIVGNSIWTVMSLPSMLGLQNLALVTRTAVPAVGLLVLLVAFLMTGRDLASLKPAARAPGTPNDNIVSKDERASQDLFYGETTSVSKTSTNQPSQHVEQDSNATFDRPAELYEAYPAQPAPKTMIMPTTNPSSLDDRSELESVTDHSLTYSLNPGNPVLAIGANDRIIRPVPENTKTGGLYISYPVPQSEEAFAKIPTVDLAVAIRDNRLNRKSPPSHPLLLLPDLNLGKVPLSPETMRLQVSNLRRKTVGRSALMSAFSNRNLTPLITDSLSVGMSSATQLSPGIERIRQRSPRHSVSTQQPQKPLPQTPSNDLALPVILQPLEDTTMRGDSRVDQTHAHISNIMAPLSLMPAKDFSRRRSSQHRDLAIEIALDESAKDVAGVSASVLNRPRPIPRKLNAEGEPNCSHRVNKKKTHKKSASTGSVISRKTIMLSPAGSPTHLPPLPPLPRRASLPRRLRPNNTKSMTFNEKVEVFWHAGKDCELNRAAHLEAASTVPAERCETKTGWDAAMSTTDGSTRSSVLTVDVFRYSTGPSVQLDEPSRSKLGKSQRSKSIQMSRGVSHRSGNRQSSIEGAKRQSSPILPPEDLRSPFNGSDGTDMPIEQTSRQFTEPSEISSTFQIAEAVVVSAVQVNRTLTNHKSKNVQRQKAVAPSGEQQIVPLCLDSAIGCNESTVRGNGPPLVSKNSHPSWHRRVGDECPTFTHRAHERTSRKMSPPPPLVLKRLDQHTIIVETEPSPIESPGHALEMIKEQLERIEALDPDTLTTTGYQDVGLLASLEKEIGQQENQWQQLRYDLKSNSISSPSETSNSYVLSARSPESSQRRSFSTMINVADLISNKVQHNFHSTGASGSASVNQHQAGRANPPLASSRMGLDSRGHLHTGDLTHRSSLLTTTSVMNIQLSIPTPPDTEESDHEDDEIREYLRQPTCRPSLWQSPISLPKGQTIGVGLWSSGSTTRQYLFSAFNKYNMVRGARRLNSSKPLTITSSRLWTPTDKKMEKPIRSQRGKLWHGARSKAITPLVLKRSLSEKPPRRGRRMTNLPDIVESPELLPDKRGALGIYQFPWGEKSDRASAQSQPSNTLPTSVNGVTPTDIMLSGYPISLMTPEYCSLFEHYTDGQYLSDESGDDFDGSDNDSEESFSEVTLWEIANLLKSNNVPSRNSLFALNNVSSFESTKSVAERVVELPDELSEDTDDDDLTYGSIPMMLDLTSFSTPPKATASWADDIEDEPTSNHMGLPQPHPTIWNCYLAANTGEIRTSVRRAVLQDITSSTLWSAKEAEPRHVSKSMLWSPTR